MAAAQALDFRDFDKGEGVTVARDVVRKYVEFLDIDRPLHNDHTAMMEAGGALGDPRGGRAAVGSLG